MVLKSIFLEHTLGNRFIQKTAPIKNNKFNGQLLQFFEFIDFPKYIYFKKMDFSKDVQMIMQKETVIALFFQVLDQDFVADTVCYADKDCQAPNARFLEKCEAYRDCGNSSQPFRCDLKFNRCLSVRQYRNCKHIFEFQNDS